MNRIHDEYRDLWARMGEHPRLRAFTVLILVLYLVAIGGLA